MLKNILIASLVVVLWFSMSEASPSGSEEDRVRCYSCQWSSKPGYKSPFSQRCTNENLRNNRKGYVETCKTGSACYVQQVEEAGRVIAVVRGCVSGASNAVVKTRYCRGNDCTKTDKSNGTTVTAHAIKCRKVPDPLYDGFGSSTRNITWIDNLSNGTVRETVFCNNDTGTLNRFCTRTTTWTDLVVGGPAGSYPGPTYTLGCSSAIDKTLWNGTDYLVTYKSCVNSFCNANDIAGAPYLKVAMTTVFGLALVAMRVNLY